MSAEKRKMRRERRKNKILGLSTDCLNYNNLFLLKKDNTFLAGVPRVVLEQHTRYILALLIMYFIKLISAMVYP